MRRYTLVGALTLVAACVFVGTVVRAVFYAPDAESPVLMEEVSSARGIGVPTRLHIPAAGVDASVQRTGITTKGAMAVPSNYADVGWYRYGTRPGEKGSAVISGHLNNGFGLDGVFADLSRLKRGDEIFVETDRGEEMRFVVVEVETYPYTEVPTEFLFNRKDVPRLNLITCDGAWVGSEKTYDRRLVVYAEFREADQI